MFSRELLLLRLATECSHLLSYISTRLSSRAYATRTHYLKRVKVQRHHYTRVFIALKNSYRFARVFFFSPFRRSCSFFSILFLFSSFRGRLGICISIYLTFCCLSQKIKIKKFFTSYSAYAKFYRSASSHFTVPGFVRVYFAMRLSAAVALYYICIY